MTRLYDAFGNVDSSSRSWTGAFGYGGPYGVPERERRRADAPGASVLRPVHGPVPDPGSRQGREEVVSKDFVIDIGPVPGSKPYG